MEGGMCLIARHEALAAPRQGSSNDGFYGMCTRHKTYVPVCSRYKVTIIYANYPNN